MSKMTIAADEHGNVLGAVQYSDGKARDGAKAAGLVADVQKVAVARQAKGLKNQPSFSG